MCVMFLTVGAGCHGTSATGISDSTFVRTIAALHEINADTALDSAGRAHARTQLLQERGLTPDALERAARALAADPERALAVWTAIDEHARTDTSAPPAPASPSTPRRR